MWFDRVSIKERAKDMIKNDLKKVAIVGLIVTLVTGGLVILPIPKILLWVLTVVSGVVVFGLGKFSLNKARGREGSIEDISAGTNYIGKAILLNLVVGIIVVVGAVFFIVPGVIAALMFSMSMYILVEDPTKSIGQCLRESKELTTGVKGDLFMFHLSFLGWNILSGLTAGLLLIIVIPYISISEAQIYLELKKVKANGNSNNPNTNNGEDNFTLL